MTNPDRAVTPPTDEVGLFAMALDRLDEALEVFSLDPGNSVVRDLSAAYFFKPIQPIVIARSVATCQSRYGTTPRTPSRLPRCARNDRLNQVRVALLIRLQGQTAIDL